MAEERKDFYNFSWKFEIPIWKRGKLIMAGDDKNIMINFN